MCQDASLTFLPSSQDSAVKAVQEAAARAAEETANLQKEQMDRVLAEMLQVKSRLADAEARALEAEKFKLEAAAIHEETRASPKLSKALDSDAEEGYRTGDKVEARFKGGAKWRPGRIANVNRDGTYDVRYDDGDDERRIESRMIRRQVDNGLQAVRETPKSATPASKALVQPQVGGTVSSTKKRTAEKKPAHQDVLSSPFGRELSPVEKAGLALARELAIKGAGEKQALHGLCLIIGDGAKVLKCGKIKKKSQNYSDSPKVSVLVDNASEFSAGAAGDGAIVINLGGDYLCASFGVDDTSLGDAEGGGMRHQAASAIAQQAGGCFVIKVSEDACGCSGKPIHDAMMDIFDRCKYAKKVPVHSSEERPPLAEASVDAIVGAINSLGEAYTIYTNEVRRNKISGALLMEDYDNDEDGAIQECLSEMRVTSSLHRRVLLKLFRDWRNADRDAANPEPEPQEELLAIIDLPAARADFTMPSLSAEAAKKMRECADGTLWCLDAAGVKIKLAHLGGAAMAIDGLDGIDLLSLPLPVLKKRLVDSKAPQHQIDQTFRFLDREGAEFYRIVLEGLRKEGHGVFALADLQWSAFVAEGSFGRVHMTSHRFSNDAVCVKFIATTPELEPYSFAYPGAQRQPRDVAQAEVEQMMRVKSRFCAQAYQYALVGDVLCVQMAYYKGGTLTELLSKNARPSEPVLRKWFLQLATGVADLHAKRICHRDLKGDNIFCSSTKPDESDLLLGDLGLAVQLDSSGQKLREFVGTPATMAPEVLEKRVQYGIKCDVWSLACVCYHIATGGLPAWQECDDFDSLFTAVPAQYSAGVADMLRFALVKDAASRPSASEVVAHLRENLAPSVVLEDEPSPDDDKGRTVEPPTQGVIREGPALMFSSESESWDPIVLSLTKSALYFRPFSYDLDGKTWTEIRFPAGAIDGASTTVNEAAEPDPNDNDEYLLYTYGIAATLKRRLEVIDKRPPLGPPPPGHMELMPDDARASRYSKLYPFALTVESDDRRLFAFKSGDDMWSWAKDIYHRGRTVTEAESARATVEALSMLLAVRHEDYESFALVESKVERCLLYGADMVNGLVVPEGKTAPQGKYVCVGGDRIRPLNMTGFKMSSLCELIEMIIVTTARDPEQAKVMIAYGFFSALANLEVETDAALFYSKKCTFLQEKLSRPEILRSMLDYRWWDEDKGLSSTYCGNAIQSLGFKYWWPGTRRRSLMPAEREIAVQLIALGTGATGNAQMEKELTELAAGSPTEIDVSEERWSRPHHNDFYDWFKANYQFDPDKYRLAITVLPVSPLLTLKDTLVSLNLAHHSLIELPEDFFQLQSLRNLSVFNNCLLSISPSISNLTALENLNVARNLLETLPVELAVLTKLQSLELDPSDKITSPPKAVWWSGRGVNLQGIQAFLKAGATSGTIENTQVKMLVLGRSEAGKTSMINALLAGSSQLTRVGDRTVGIDQHTLNMRLESDAEFAGALVAGDLVEAKPPSESASFNVGDVAYYDTGRGFHDRVVIARLAQTPNRKENGEEPESKDDSDSKHYDITVVADGEAKAVLTQLFDASKPTEGLLREGSAAFYEQRGSVYVPVTIGKVTGDECELHKTHLSVARDAIAVPLSLIAASARICGVCVIVRFRESDRFDSGFAIHAAREDGSFDLIAEMLREDVPPAQLAVPPVALTRGAKVHLKVEEGGDKYVRAVVVAVRENSTCDVTPVGDPTEHTKSELLAPADSSGAPSVADWHNGIPCLVKTGITFVAASIADACDDGTFDVIGDQKREVSLADLARPVVASALSGGDDVFVRMDDADILEASRIIAISSDLKCAYRELGAHKRKPASDSRKMLTLFPRALSALGSLKIGGECVSAWTFVNWSARKNVRSTLTTADPADTDAIANQSALAGTIVQIRKGESSLIELALAAQRAGAVGVLFVSDDANPVAAPSTEDAGSTTFDLVVKVAFPRLEEISSSFDELGRVKEDLSEEAQRMGLESGSVLVGVVCPRLGTPMQCGHDLSEMIQGCLGSNEDEFQRNLVTSGLLAPEQEFEDQAEEIMETLEIELRFRPAIAIPVVMVSGNVGVQTPGTPVVFEGLDGSTASNGAMTSCVQITQVKEEEGDYHTAFFDAVPVGGLLRWSIELGEEGNSRSWRLSRLGIATCTDEVDTAPSSCTGLNLGIWQDGKVYERKDGRDKRSRCSGQTQPGQALVFELDLSGEGEFSVYRGVKAGSSWAAGELVHRFTGCHDLMLKDYAWHPCVARMRIASPKRSSLSCCAGTCVWTTPARALS